MTRTKSIIHVIDDDPSVLKALKRLLRSSGFRVETYPSAEQFLASADRELPGCLVLDVRMPGMSGIQLQQELSASGCHLPVIIITAHEDAGARQKAMEEGAIAFLMKPFDENALLDAIRKAIESDA